MTGIYSNGMYEGDYHFKLTLGDILKDIQKELPTFESSYAENAYGMFGEISGLKGLSPEEAFKSSGLKSFNDAFNGKRNFELEAMFDQIAAPYKIENDPVKVINWRPSGSTYNNFNQNSIW